MRTWLRFALMMLALLGTWQLSRQIDRLMLGALLSAQSVGIYDIAETVSAQIAIALTVFNVIVFPLAGSLFHNGELEQLGFVYRTATRWVLAVTLPLLLIVVLSGDLILGLFGAGFAAGYRALVILAVGHTLNAAAGGVGGILQMTGREVWVVANTVIFGVVAVIGNYLLIPPYGLSGAAIATAGALMLWNLLGLVQIYWFHGLHPFSRSQATLWFGCLLGAVPGWLLRWGLPEHWGGLAGAGVAVVLYAVVVVARGLTEEDRAVARALTGRR